jgi:amino acid transporter
VAIRNAVGFLGGSAQGPDGFWYAMKLRLLGPPKVNEQLHHERLSKALALGVLSPDGISSSAYGTEEILIALLPVAGLAAFTLILPMTLVVLVVMVLVVLSYREVVMVYIRPAGSYVVARENFGPKIAQVAAVALLIDYVVTVAIQAAAGTAAVVSAFPALGGFTREITIGVILVMCYGNLRGIREAGRAFAVPTYLFAGSVILMIVTGLVREVLGDLHRYDPHTLGTAGHPTYAIGSGTEGVLTFLMIFTLLRAFANGGASLTGIEAVSDAVGAFQPPEGINARRVLVTEGFILGFLVAGISWLAHETRATPFKAGNPTVLAQEAQVVFGHTFVGHALFLLVQAATALILYTGGNTSFNGFPYLASYVAGDAFLPRWLLKRGHRLVFSNAIVGLTIVSIALVIIRGANVNNLVPLYAIGVFTAFTMAGFGMARYHLRHKEPGWHHKLVTNAAAGGLTAVVVAIFAIVKFTEGAWLVVVLFPILVFALIRLNQEYTMEATVLERIGERPKPPDVPNYPRRTVFVLVDSFDLATLAALRYARSLRPTTLRAVHFVIDNVQAEMLREEWARGNRGVVLDFIDCPDRRLNRAATDLVSAEAAHPGTHVTAVLPRRSYSPLLGRFLHDRTADKIAGAVSRIPHSAATIVPFDVRSRLEIIQEREVAKNAQASKQGTAPTDRTAAAPEREGRPAKPPLDAWLRHRVRSRLARQRREAAQPAGDHPSYERPAPSPGVNPIGSIQGPGRATVEGRVHAVEIRPVERNAVLAVEISDSTGDLTALFYGRTHIPGIVCGARVRFRGPLGMREEGPVMINPAYELLSQGAEPPPHGEDSR